MQTLSRKLVDGLVLIFWCAMKLKFVRTVWGIFPRSTCLKPTCQPSIVLHRSPVLREHPAVITLPPWSSPYSCARTSILLMHKVISLSYLQLHDKWFEVHGYVQAIRLWQQMRRFYQGGCSVQMKSTKTRKSNLTHYQCNVTHVQTLSHIIWWV